MAIEGVIAFLFERGHAADLILAVLAAEALWLGGRQSWSARAIAGLLGPAALIVLGLRAAMVGADWWWIALPLAASFPLHLMDLRTRLTPERPDRADP
ncbi:hypothetical protein [Erythrobacter donghaensis]|uniref:hypothetical protein n=1 Tax=Erythrobacter donghaensis TaxID=267135 RepID=UPI001FE8860D|nr:hypothetical protein [Erythrobacter donghaensis]